MLSITQKSKISFLVQRAKSVTVVDTISTTVNPLSTLIPNAPKILAQKITPRFSAWGELERIHDGFEGSVCDISSQILTFFSSHGKMYILRGGT
ncbi:MAG: hypothetical protein SPK29_03620 [Peptoniphilaceae bacterium]|nr:hypothetical protein [Peptoniphilaceae bacterium]